MRLNSLAFKNNATIPAQYTCDGQDVNPPLEISEVPENTKSLVLVADDPDAAVGDWVHWLVWNIKPDTKEIAENSVPSGAVEGVTSFGQPGYGGPCPPKGTHRYFFRLYALDIDLNLDQNADKQQLEIAIKDHIIDQTKLIGLYTRR